MFSHSDFSVSKILCRNKCMREPSSNASYLFWVHCQCSFHTRLSCDWWGSISRNWWRGREKTLSLVCSKAIRSKDGSKISVQENQESGHLEGCRRDWFQLGLHGKHTFVVDVTHSFRPVKLLEVTEGAKFHSSHLLALAMMKRWEIGGTKLKMNTGEVWRES